MKNITKPFIKVAYFSMEYMLRTNIPTYAGGLGVLSGDLLRSCADMQVPAVGITLVYNGKSFNQVFQPDGSQTYEEVEWRKNDQFIKMPDHVSVEINGQEVIIGCWRYDIVGYSNFIVPVYLLDTDIIENEGWKRRITDKLYDENSFIRIAQEIILGIGGVKMLHELGYKEIDIYHLNEGHAAFVPLALLPEHNNDINEVRRHCVFTTHTPLAEGHDKFDYKLAFKAAHKYLPKKIKTFSDPECLDMTYLALNSSKYSFGVSRKHQDVSHYLFPGYPIDYITNGVHPRTWVASVFQDLFNKYLPGWIEDPLILKQAPQNIPDNALLQAHKETKQTLIDYVNHHLTSIKNEEEKQNPPQNEFFDLETLTISFARRPVSYKRPLLIYSDIQRLLALSNGRLQIIQSGKSHPSDTASQDAVKHVLDLSKKLRGTLKIVYLENYSPKLARLLVSGTDIWLNTPRRPLEASGTSGMKASLNGVLNFSIADGWWIEGYEQCPKAGFLIGNISNKLYPINDDKKDADNLYKVLEKDIIPLYYNNKKEWVQRMKFAITLGAYFNTNRCIQEYLEKAW